MDTTEQLNHLDFFLFTSRANKTLHLVPCVCFDHKESKFVMEQTISIIK